VPAFVVVHRGARITVARYGHSLAVGRVEESRSSDLHPGEYLSGVLGWQDLA
jgi:hypothetical protein